MKKLISLLLVGALAFSMITGCGKSENKVESSAVENSESEAGMVSGDKSQAGEEVSSEDMELSEASSDEEVASEVSTNEEVNDAENGDEQKQELNCYTFLVKNQDGVGVPGVRMQVCNDEMCQMLVTGDDGIVTYDGEPMAYEVHIIKCPEGYTYDTEKIYTTSTEYEMVEFVLE